MIHLDKVLSLKEPIIFTSHTILLFSDSSRVTWHDSQLKIIIICLLGPWRIFFSSPALKKTTKKKQPKNHLCPILLSSSLSLTPHSLLSKLLSDWHRRSEQLVVFCLRERKYTHAHWSLEYSRLFSSSSRRKKNASLLTSLVVFWYESCKRWETPANYLKKWHPAILNKNT